MSNEGGMRCFYAATALRAGGLLEDKRLEKCTDRHRIRIERPILNDFDPGSVRLIDPRTAGLVIEMVHGWPSRVHLQMGRAALGAGKTVWFYWPHEGAIERIDRERLASYARLWLVVQGRDLMFHGVMRLRQVANNFLPSRSRRIAARLYHALKSRLIALASPSVIRTDTRLDDADRVTQAARATLVKLVADSHPVSLTLDKAPTPKQPLIATGAYLRTDFWAKITTGGSYGHTCYVARELARTTERFVCYMPVHYALLSDLGINQVAMDSPGPSSDEVALIRANEHYHRWLTRALAESKPAFIYERLCLGNFVGARLSQELRIPYFVEYNGSEISMRKSFGSGAYQHEDIFLAAEEAAFGQATLISVVSEAVRDDVVRRGIDSRKVLVNPNGVDLEAYRPPPPATRAMLRRELGFSETDRVVGFIGTFGGWHGVDVLAAALPALCHRLPTARFLLIGDGDNRALIDKAIDAHHLKHRVICTGRVAHHEGARLLGACDIYISPHSSHMVDSRFFGSPTKLFEYMGLGGGIVASDLEQIGQVLAPAWRADALPGPRVSVSNERAVLCKPGDVTEFVDAVAFLVERPDICEALGRNARLAAEREFSWERHIERLWNFAVERMPTGQGRQP